MTVTHRDPSTKAKLVATTGTVLIHTVDKVETTEGERFLANTVVMTPKLARQVAGQLLELADLAEGKDPKATQAGILSWKGWFTR